MARYRNPSDDPYAGQGRFNQQSPFQDAAPVAEARYPSARDPNATEEPVSTPYQTQAQGGMVAPTYRGAAGYNPSSLVSDYERRGTSKRGPIGSLVGGTAGGIGGGALLGGKMGIWGGPIGAAAGSIIGGLVGGLAGGRQADTAGTDFRVEDARQAIIGAYQQLFGRTPSQIEVDGHLQNVGWRPGHKFVGEQGLAAILNNLPSGAQNSDIDALNGEAPSGATLPATAQPSQTATTATPTLAEGQRMTWGFDSPTGGKREIAFTPGNYEGEIGPYSGFDAAKVGQNDSLKYTFLDMTRGLPPTVESLPELVRRLNEAGIPAQQVGYDLIDFGLGEGPMDVVNQTRGGVWDWQPTIGSGPAPAGGGGAAFGALPGQGDFGALTDGFNYESLIQAILKDTLGA